VLLVGQLQIDIHHDTNGVRVPASNVPAVTEVCSSHAVHTKKPSLGPPRLPVSAPRTPKAVVARAEVAAVTFASALVSAAIGQCC